MEKKIHKILKNGAGSLGFKNSYKIRKGGSSYVCSQRGGWVKKGLKHVGLSNIGMVPNRIMVVLFTRIFTKKEKKKK